MRVKSPAGAKAAVGYLLSTHPGAVAISFALLHFAGLSLAILVTQPTVNLDVLEQIAWSREPQWAYAKHPPLTAWIMAAVMWATGHKPWAAALLGPFASAAALLMVWVFARRMLDPGRALIAMFLLEGVIYFNFASVEFNHNVILLPLWAFIAYAAHRVYCQGSPADWALLGLAAALGMLGKYATVLLLAGVLVAFAANTQGRIRLWTRGPLITLVCASMILAPHIRALSRVDFAPFKYACDRLAIAASAADHLRFPLGWLAAQAVNTAPAILMSCVVLLALRPHGSGKAPPLRGSHNPEVATDLQFAAILFATPLFLAVAIQALGGVRFRDMWGFPMFVLSGVVVALFTAGPPLRQDLLPKLALASVACLALAMSVIAAVSLGSPFVTKKGARHQYAARELAAATGSRWTSLYGPQPLRFAVADAWLGGMLAAYHPDHPPVLLSGDFKRSPWVTPREIRQSGAVLVWDADHDGDKLMKLFPEAVPQRPLELAFHTQARVPPARVGWAILPPLNSVSLAARGRGRRHP